MVCIVEKRKIFVNVVLYLRYSSDKQNEQSIEGQQRICEDFCRRNDYQIIGTYIDRALSASKNTEKREQFQLMIRDSDKHKFDAVIVYKLDRFSRDRYDSAVYKNRLKKNGVRVISATENISDTPEGVILESVLEGMAEFYSKELAQKVTRGMNETALKCNSCGGQIPLGYKIVEKKFVIDERTSPIVKEAFERYASGEILVDIIDDFNARGLRTSRGVEFNKNSFRSMFRNERYIGIYKYKDIKIEDGIPAIIDKELFYRVQERVKLNDVAPARAKARVEYLLAQKLYCGHCGSLMIGESGKSHSGETYYYYTCSKRKKDHSCDKKNIRKEWVEQTVVEDAIALLTPQHIDEIADIAVNKCKEEAAKDEIVPAIKADLSATEKSISNLLKMVEKGADSDSLLQRLNDLECQRKALSIQLDEALRDITILEKDQVVWWLNQFAQGDPNDPDFRRRVVEMLISSVTVWDEPDGRYKITTIYNLKSENSKTKVTSAATGSDLTLNGPPLEYYPNKMFFFGAFFGYTTVH